MNPPQVSGRLHAIDIPSFADIENLLMNGKNPENVTMLTYWIRQVEEKGYNLGILDPFYEDAVFLATIEWLWFLDEVEQHWRSHLPKKRGWHGELK